MTKIGDNIRKLREARGWTQLELGKMCGIDAKHVSALERGKSNPGNKILPLLCDAFMVDEQTLKYGERKKTPSDNRLGLALEEFEKAFEGQETKEDQLALVSDLFAMLARRTKGE